MPDPLWAIFSVIGGSILGAVISAIISLLIQKRNLDEAKKQRDEDRLEVRKAIGYSLLFKMIRLASNLHNLGVAMQGCFERAAKAGFKGDPWQIVQPIVPATDPVNFSAEEMALLLSLDDKLFNEIASLDQLHNSTAAIFDLYGQKREKIMERFGAVMSGDFGSSSLTLEEVNWLAPRGVELNGLLAAMRERSLVDGKEAWSALEQLRDLLEAKLAIKHRLERKKPGER